jgi:hypothetical protein
MGILEAPGGPDSPFCMADWRWRRAEYLARVGILAQPAVGVLQAQP